MPYAIAIELDVPGGTPRPDVTALETMMADVLAAEGVGDGASVAVVLTGDEAVRALNRAHRDTDEPTDVLSFPADEGEAFPAGGDTEEPRYLGDIAVSLEAVARQAAELGLPFELEARHVVLHGLLHLLGHDHLTPVDEDAMRAREERVLGATIHADARRHAD